MSRGGPESAGEAPNTEQSALDVLKLAKLRGLQVSIEADEIYETHDLESFKIVLIRNDQTVAKGIFVEVTETEPRTLYCMQHPSVISFKQHYGTILYVLAAKFLAMDKKSLISNSVFEIDKETGDAPAELLWNRLCELGLATAQERGYNFVSLSQAEWERLDQKAVDEIQEAKKESNLQAISHSIKLRLLRRVSNA